MSKIKLTIAYDGSDFFGFQMQSGTKRTVQGVLQAILTKVSGGANPVGITGAGRTDSGVHARKQVVTFESDGRIPTDRWPWILNHRFPRDLLVLSAEQVPDSFHPRYDATGKTYQYTIETAKIPDIFTRRFCTHLWQPLDLTTMREAARYLVGTHDFTSFSAARAQVSNRVRTIRQIHIEQVDTLIRLWFQGDGFLQHMVRILTGTLVEVGTGDRAAADIPHILAEKNRSMAGRTMPPQGLTLWDVHY